MKKKHFSRLWLVAFILLFAGVTACIPVPVNPAPVQVTISNFNELQSTFTPIPTLTPLPTATATATPPLLGCSEQSGRIERGQVDTALLTKPLVFRAYLPPCFRPASAELYPVLVLLHGQGFRDDQWERLGVAQAADELIVSGYARPFLIVMPYEENSLINIQDSAFGQAIVDALVPYITQRYPACTERACRAIGGISRGAIWAVRIGFIRWEAFGAIGAHSYPVSGDPAGFSNWLGKIPADQLPKLYVDIGTRDDYLNAAVKFAGMLNDLRVPHEWHLNPGNHTEEYWKAHTAEYLRWYVEQIAAP
jgi:enterochelin esterase-like enzyme